jgi:hypothetical protein
MDDPSRPPTKVKKSNPTPEDRDPGKSNDNRNVFVDFISRTGAGSNRFGFIMLNANR